MKQEQLGQEFGYTQNRIAMLLPIYPNLVNFYDQKISACGYFSNKITLCVGIKRSLNYF